MADPIVHRKRRVSKADIIALRQQLSNEGLQNSFTGGVPYHEKPPIPATSIKPRPQRHSQLRISPLYETPVGVTRTCYWRKTRAK